MPASSRILSCSHGILSSASYLPAARFFFHKKPLCLWKTVRILFTFPCRYAVCIPVFAHKLPLFTQSLPEFPAISCLVHPQFIFILHDRIYRGPYYRPQLEELLCTKPNSRATPKDDRHCICRDPCGVAAAQFLGLPRHDERPGQTGRLRHLPEHARRRRTEHR